MKRSGVDGVAGLVFPPVRAEELAFPVSYHLEIHGLVGFFFFFPSLGIVPSRPWVDDTLRLSWKMAETGTGNQAAGWTSGLGGHREENEGELAAPAWTFASPCAHPLAEHIYFSLLKRFFFSPPPPTVSGPYIAK